MQATPSLPLLEKKDLEPYIGVFHLLLYGKVCFPYLPNNKQSTLFYAARRKADRPMLIGSNQAVNFTAYAKFKELLQTWQPEYTNVPLPSYQTTLIGLVSGAMGPLSNAPIDTIKTRLQKNPGKFGETAMSRITAIARDMFKYVLVFVSVMTSL